MKTEIIYKYNLEEGFYIKKVLPIDKDNFAVLTSKYPDVLKLEIVGNTNEAFVISDMPEINPAFEKSLFAYKDTIAIICGTHKLLLWESIMNKPHLVEIKNPFKPDTHDYGYKHYTINASYDFSENALYFTLEDKRMMGFPARFWAKLDLNCAKPNWSKLNELNLKYYPQTEFNRFPWTDWLNICDLMKKDDHLYIHTTGGKITRLKSGKRYEFSIISKLTQDNHVLKNYTIAEGTGLFTTKKDYFILHPRNKKKSLCFYNTASFEVDFEVSLTPKQNLGQEKSNFIRTDLLDENLYVYNSRFLNICKLIK